MLEHPDVDVVYIPLPNGMHREWTERAAAAGKHVLCEKPLAADPDTARAMADACATAGVILAEAWMTPFDRRWSTALELVRTGAIGDVDAQYHRFTFTIGPEAADNYRWDPTQGGGALLDVGIYTLGTAVELWGADCEIDSVQRTMAPSGVDATTVAEPRVARRPPGAQIRCSFVDDGASAGVVPQRRRDAAARARGVHERRRPRPRDRSQRAAHLPGATRPRPAPASRPKSHRRATIPTPHRVSSNSSASPPATRTRP